MGAVGEEEVGGDIKYNSEISGKRMGGGDGEGKGPIYALDFDGVICDSVGESTVSAWRAANRIWGSEVFGDEGDVEGWLMDAMRVVRGVVETGWENVVLVRLIWERCKGGVGVEDVCGEILREWGRGLKEGMVEEYGVGKEVLVEVFGAVRDEWIERDLDGWCGANRFYPGVVEMLNGVVKGGGDLFLITTKQKRFVEVLLKKFGVNGLSGDRIFGLGSGSKIKVLKELIAREDFKGRFVEFVEDRYETLEAVSLSMLGQPLKLYLATWGYNTKEVRARAEKHPLINTLELQAFTSNFQY